MIISLATSQKLKKTNPASHHTYKIQHKITHNPNVSFLEHKRNKHTVPRSYKSTFSHHILFYFPMEWCSTGPADILRCQMFFFPTHGASH
jgi:hypothetical protein